MRVSSTGLRALGLALCATVLLTAPASAADGWLDPTFSGDGVVWLPTNEPLDPFPARVAVRPGPTGRIFLGRQLAYSESDSMDVLALGSHGGVGTGFNGGAWSTELESDEGTSMIGLYPTTDGGAIAALSDGWDGLVRLGRYGPGGGLARLRTHAISNGHQLARSSLEQLPGGSLRMCHHEQDDGITRLIGLTPSLERDTRVGPDGLRALELEGCQGTAADAAGHLYFATFRRADDTVGSRQLLELLRTNSSGVTDTAWGDSGHTIVGRAGLHVLLANPDRAPTIEAPGFGFAASPMLPQPNGSVFIAAEVTRVDPAGRPTAAVLRLMADGALDPSFGSGGMRAFGPTGGESRIMAMAVDSAGRPVLSVAYRYSDGRTRYWLARLTTSGAFDPTFGSGGLIGQSYPAESIAFDSSGRILTAARTPSGTIVVARRNG